MIFIAFHKNYVDFLVNKDFHNRIDSDIDNNGKNILLKVWNDHYSYYY